MSKPLKVRLSLRVQPNATRLEAVGWHGDAQRIRVAASPIGGKANAAAADTLAVSRSSVSIVRGHSSRDKVVEVAGLDDGELRRRLSPG